MATVQWGRTIYALALGSAMKSEGSSVSVLPVCSMMTTLVGSGSVGAVWLLSSVGFGTVGKKVAGVPVVPGVSSSSSHTSPAPLPEYDSPEPSLKSIVTPGA